MNTNCLNCGDPIAIAIFRGTGFCCVDCKKAFGIDHKPKGNLMFLTKEEEMLVREFRERS